MYEALGKVQPQIENTSCRAVKSSKSGLCSLRVYMPNIDSFEGGLSERDLVYRARTCPRGLMFARKINKESTMSTICDKERC